jgi:hypothetical protein
MDPLSAKIIERATIDVIHDKVRPPVIHTGPNVVRLNQSAIMNPPQNSRLSKEAVASVAVVGPVVGKHLDSNGHVEVIVMAEPHGRKTPGAEAPDQLLPPYGVHRNHRCRSFTPLTGCNLGARSLLAVCTGCNLSRPSGTYVHVAS